MSLKKLLLLPHTMNEVYLSCGHPMENDSVHDGAYDNVLNYSLGALRLEDGDGNAGENVALKVNLRF